MDAAAVESAVKLVIEEVRRRGDEALLELTERWDKVRLTPSTLRVPLEPIEAAPVNTPFAEAFRRAAARIERFHEAVKPRSISIEEPGSSRLAIRWTPIRSVGLYVPGGKATYPSTLAMTAIPARIAGVERIIVVSPPGPSGEVSPEVLLAAKVLGLGEVYRVGGAQAIAALALGTATIPRVDKIFGPGNAFVAEAKKQLYGEVGIDLLAGPSEVVVYVDETAEPGWAAADLMAQAEHDEQTRVTLLASSATVLRITRAAMEELVGVEPRAPVIRASWEANGTFEVVPSEDEAARRIDEIAPEHLSIQSREPGRLLSKVRNAGAIFLGRHSPVAVGDYFAGPNHVLPTGRSARFASCLSVEDFMKRSNVIELSEGFVAEHGRDVEILAEGERLPAHATSVRLRRERVRSSWARPGLRAPSSYAIVEEDAPVKLNQNESPWDVPLEIKDEVARRLRDLPWNRYHQRIPQELLARIAADGGVEPSQVIAASGSNLILQWIFEGFAAPGSTILAPAPSFSLYDLWAQVCEARLVGVPLSPDHGYDAGAFTEAIRRESPSIVVLCLPNNPTGSELALDGVRAIAAAALEQRAVLVIDEAYKEFSEARFDRGCLLKSLPNLILVRTCSKAFSAAGMRLGYCFAAPEVARDLSKLVPPFHLNLFATILGQVLWERKGLFEERVKTLVEERDRLRARLGALPGVTAFATHANFFLARVPRAEELCSSLRAQGILVRRPGGHPSLQECVRINAGTAEENERLVQAVQSHLVAIAKPRSEGHGDPPS